MLEDMMTQLKTYNRIGQRNEIVVFRASSGGYRARALTPDAEAWLVNRRPVNPTYPDAFGGRDDLIDLHPSEVRGFVLDAQEAGFEVA